MNPWKKTIIHDIRVGDEFLLYEMLSRNHLKVSVIKIWEPKYQNAYKFISTVNLDTSKWEYYREDHFRDLIQEKLKWACIEHLTV